MTSLHFTGGIPLWAGLVVALIVAVLSFRYYRRDCFDVIGKTRWFLPLLRSTAFFLGVVILTGPVLKHRQVIGELGQVKIYFDMSESMTLSDPHMSTGRKLLIAEQLGWIEEGRLDDSLLRAADQLRIARLEFVKQLSTSSDDEIANSEGMPSSEVADQNSIAEARIRSAIDVFVGGVGGIQVLLKEARIAKTTETDSGEADAGIPVSTFAARFERDVLQPMTQLSNSAADGGIDGSVEQLLGIVDRCIAIERDLMFEFESLATSLMTSQDPSVAAAISQFDESPRWRRAEMELFGSSTDVYRKLRKLHDVQLLMLSANEAIARDPRDSAESTNGDRMVVYSEEFSDQTDLSSGVVATHRGGALLGEDLETMPDGEIDTVAKPKSAVVLFTDGNNNAGPSPLQTAKILGGQGIAFYCVSIGASEAAADLSVRRLEYPSMVFLNDRVRGTMIVRDHLPKGQPFVAQIRYGEKVVWQDELLANNENERRIDFEFPVEELANQVENQFQSEIVQNVLPLTLEASVAALMDEHETGNNQQAMHIAVMQQRNRVMIIDGRSRWEVRYLKNVFERDEHWQVNTVIAGPGTDAEALPKGKQPGQFPDSRDALFEYDLVFIGEISPDLFTDAEQTWLREFVEIRGGGMVFVDGARGKLRQWGNREPGALLPVEWVATPIEGKPSALKLTGKGIEVGALTLLTDRQQNERFWSELPTPDSLLHVETLPGSEVLVEADVSGKLYPAIVTRMSGAGRVLYMAFDETWRWRYKAADTWHQRVWNQLAQFVMPRPFAVRGEYLSVDTGAISYNPGDDVDVRIRLVGLDGKPNSSALAEALVWKDGKVVSTIKLNPDSQVPGIYRGRVSGLSGGDYEVSIQASGYNESALQARSEFVVLSEESVEFNELSANEDLLRQVAELSDGAFLREDEVGRLPELLEPLSSGKVVESETLLWQSYWWFMAILGLLTSEWILRKRAGLL